MPYLTDFEREAKLETLREYIIEIIESRFSVIPNHVISEIKAIDNLDLLKRLLKKVVKIASLRELETLLLP